MKQFLSAAVIGLMLAACGGSQQNDGAETTSQQADDLITCDGIGKVLLSYSHEDLEEQFGADQLADETATQDGKSVQVTRVFKDTPEEVTVTWEEASAPFTKAVKLSVSDEFSPYRLEEGIQVGSTLKDLVRANNFLPVTFSNFYSADDGFANIQDFNEGDIGQKYPCLGGSMDIDRTDNIDVYLLDDFKAENPVKSNHKAMEFIYANITELSISAD